MTPVTVVTGFLGSGKTTLLRHLLKQPALVDTAVIVNELGEVGLDHLLLETSDDQIVQLDTGCLCCAIRGDLARTVEDLLARRDAGTLPPFRRIAIETSGLADPAPILQTLMADGPLAGRIGIDRVVTTVDAVNGAATLDRHPESLKQAAVADRIVLTKTDLADADILRARIAGLNPSAETIVAVDGRVDADWLLGGETPAAPRPWPGGHAHTEGVESYCILRDAPVSAVGLTLFLEALAENCGADLLRVKGLVHVAESPDRPAVIHGVQHVFHPPVWLDRWPDADRRTRLVFITRDIPRDWVDSLLTLLDTEARQASAGISKGE